MRLRMASLACLLVLAGCESDQEQARKKMERQIHATIEADWHRDIPLNDLADAAKSCEIYPDYSGCDTLQTQILDVSIAFESCRADQQSKLCQAVVQMVGKHQISAVLPKTSAVQLPDTPFYWNLPTSFLESQSSNFGYRSEVADRWWQFWAGYVLSCLALLTMVPVGWYWWNKRSKAEQERAEQEKIRHIQQVKARAAAKHKEQQARIEAEQRAMLESEAIAAEQKRLEDQMAEDQQAAEAARKLAAEQASAAALLRAVCSSSTVKKRRR